MEGY
jgi:hypothetical protein